LHAGMLSNAVPSAGFAGQNQGFKGNKYKPERHLTPSSIFTLPTEMKLSSILREVAIIVYFLIFVKGLYINFPLIAYLLFTLGSFGTDEQIFSSIAFLGIFVHFFHPNYRKKTTKLMINGMVFLFLLTPVVHQLFTLPLDRFNYRWFLIPGISFFVMYAVSLALLGREIITGKKIMVSDDGAIAEEKEEVV